MIHYFDQIRFRPGEPRVGVFARGEIMVDSANAEVPNFDAATTMFWAASGATVTIQNCRRASHRSDRRVEIFGSKRTIAKGNVPRTQTELVDQRGYHSSGLPEYIPQRYGEVCRNELAAIAEALEVGRMPERRRRPRRTSLLRIRICPRSFRRTTTWRLVPLK